MSEKGKGKWDEPGVFINEVADAQELQDYKIYHGVDLGKIHTADRLCENVRTMDTFRPDTNLPIVRDWNFFHHPHDQGEKMYDRTYKVLNIGVDMELYIGSVEDHTRDFLPDCTIRTVPEVDNTVSYPQNAVDCFVTKDPIETLYKIQDLMECLFKVFEYRKWPEGNVRKEGGVSKILVTESKKYRGNACTVILAIVVFLDANVELHEEKLKIQNRVKRIGNVNWGVLRYWNSFCSLHVTYDRKFSKELVDQTRLRFDFEQAQTKLKSTKNAVENYVTAGLPSDEKGKTTKLKNEGVSEEKSQGEKIEEKMLNLIRCVKTAGEDGVMWKKTQGFGQSQMKGYDEVGSQTFQAGVYDDLDSASATIAETCFKLQANIEAAAECGIQFSLRKFNILHSSTVALGYLFERGVQKIEPSKLETVLRWHRIPFSAASLRSLLAFCVYISRTIGPEWSDMLKILTPYSRLENDKEYEGIIKDKEAVQALTRIRMRVGTYSFRQMQGEKLVTGNRVLIILIDASIYGCCAVVLSLEKSVWEEKKVQGHWGEGAHVHGCYSNPWPSTHKAITAAEAEALSMLNYFTQYDHLYSPYPRHLMCDHRNLVKMKLQTQLHPATIRARNRLLLILRTQLNDPMLHCYHIAGEVNTIADLGSRQCAQTLLNHLPELKCNQHEINSELQMRFHTDRDSILEEIFPIREIPVEETVYDETVQTNWLSKRKEFRKIPNKNMGARRKPTLTRETGADCLKRVIEGEYHQVGVERPKVDVELTVERFDEIVEREVQTVSSEMCFMLANCTEAEFLLQENAKMEIEGWKRHRIENAHDVHGSMEVCEVQGFKDYYFTSVEWLRTKKILRYRWYSEDIMEKTEPTAIIWEDKKCVVGGETVLNVLRDELGIHLTSIHELIDVSDIEGYAKELGLMFIANIYCYRVIGNIIGSAKKCAAVYTRYKNLPCVILGASSISNGSLYEDNEILLKYDHLGDLEGSLYAFHLQPKTVHRVYRVLATYNREFAIQLVPTDEAQRSEVFTVNETSGADVDGNTEGSEVERVDEIISKVKCSQEDKIRHKRLSDEEILKIHRANYCRSVEKIYSFLRNETNYKVSWEQVKGAVGKCLRCRESQLKAPVKKKGSLRPISRRVWEVDICYLDEETHSVHDIEDDIKQFIFDQNLHKDGSGRLKGYRCVVDGLGYTSVQKCVNTNIVNHLMMFEQMTGITPEEIRVSDSEAWSAQLAEYAKGINAHIPLPAAKEPNQTTSMVSPRQYLVKRFWTATWEGTRHLKLTLPEICDLRRGITERRLNEMSRCYKLNDLLPGASVDLRRAARGLIDYEVVRIINSKKVQRLLEHKLSNTYIPIQQKVLQGEQTLQVVFLLDEKRWVQGRWIGMIDSTHCICYGGMVYRRAACKVLWRKSVIRDNDHIHIGMYTKHRRPLVNHCERVYEVYKCEVAEETLSHIETNSEAFREYNDWCESQVTNGKVCKIGEYHLQIGEPLENQIHGYVTDVVETEKGVRHVQVHAYTSNLIMSPTRRNQPHWTGRPGETTLGVCTLVWTNGLSGQWWKEKLGESTGPTIEEVNEESETDSAKESDVDGEQKPKLDVEDEKLGKRRRDSEIEANPHVVDNSQSNPAKRIREDGCYDGEFTRGKVEKWLDMVGESGSTGKVLNGTTDDAKNTKEESYQIPCLKCGRVWKLHFKDTLKSRRLWKHDRCTAICIIFRLIGEMSLCNHVGVCENNEVRKGGQSTEKRSRRLYMWRTDPKSHEEVLKGKMSACDVIPEIGPSYEICKWTMERKFEKAMYIRACNLECVVPKDELALHICESVSRGNVVGYYHTYQTKVQQLEEYLHYIENTCVEGSFDRTEILDVEIGELQIRIYFRTTRWIVDISALGRWSKATGETKIAQRIHETCGNDEPIPEVDYELDDSVVRRLQGVKVDTRHTEEQFTVGVYNSGSEESEIFSIASANAGEDLIQEWNQIKATSEYFVKDKVEFEFAWNQVVVGVIPHSNQSKITKGRIPVINMLLDSGARAGPPPDTGIDNPELKLLCEENHSLISSKLFERIESGREVKIFSNPITICGFNSKVDDEAPKVVKLDLVLCDAGGEYVRLNGINFYISAFDLGPKFDLVLGICDICRLNVKFNSMFFVEIMGNRNFLKGRMKHGCRPVNMSNPLGEEINKNVQEYHGGEIQHSGSTSVENQERKKFMGVTEVKLLTVDLSMFPRGSVVMFWLAGVLKGRFQINKVGDRLNNGAITCKVPTERCIIVELRAVGGKRVLDRGSALISIVKLSGSEITNEYRTRGEFLCECVEFNAANYKTRGKNDEQTQPNQDLFRELECEQGAWLAAQNTHPQGSENWCVEILKQGLRNLNELEVTSDIGDFKGEKQVMVEAFVCLIAYIAVIRSHTFSGEGHPTPSTSAPEIGLEVIDFCKRMVKTGKSMKYSDFDGQRLRFLMHREEVMKRSKPHEYSNDGHLYCSAAIFPAPRSKTVTGRVVADLRRINSIAIELEISPIISENVFRNLRKERARYYLSMDVSHAFPSLQFSKELRKWMGLLGPNSIQHIALRGMLGFSPLPAIWSSWIYPRFNSLMTNGRGVHRYRELMIEGYENELVSIKEAVRALVSLI